MYRGRWQSFVVAKLLYKVGSAWLSPECVLHPASARPTTPQDDASVRHSDKDRLVHDSAPTPSLPMRIRIRKNVLFILPCRQDRRHISDQEQPPHRCVYRSKSGGVKLPTLRARKDRARALASAANNRTDQNHAAAADPIFSSVRPSLPSQSRHTSAAMLRYFCLLWRSAT